MRERSLVMAAGMALGVIALQGSPLAAPVPQDVRNESRGPCDFTIGAPFEVPTGVPIEVRHVEASAGTVVARVVNVASQSIVAYEARLSTVCGDAGAPRHFLAMASASALDWRPGTEVLVRLPSDVFPEHARVDIMAVVLADGSGYGDPKVVNRFRRDARDHLDGRVGVLAILTDAPVPATDDDLQALIDRVALAMARVPVSGPSALVLSPYMETVAALTRLRGRGMAGTERLERELQAVRARWQRELEMASPSLATATRGR